MLEMLKGRDIVKHLNGEILESSSTWDIWNSVKDYYESIEKTIN